MPSFSLYNSLITLLLTVRNLFTAIVFLGVLTTVAHAQIGTRIFAEDFGHPVGRVISPNTPTGSNSFIFANPTVMYPTNPMPSNTWTTDPFYWKFTAKAIENNHYAVVAPTQIYSSVTEWEPGVATPPNNLWLTWSTSGTNIVPTDGSGDPNGGMFVVNAGTTKGILYQIPTRLQRGKFYVLTYKVFAAHLPTKIRTSIITTSGGVEIGSQIYTESTQRSWKTVTQYIAVDGNSCSSETYTLSLVNESQANNGNDYVIDDIVVTEVASSETFTIIEAPCSNSPEVPQAADDQSLNNVHTEPISSVTINIFSNDSMDESGAIPTSFTATFNYIVPAGATLGLWDSGLTVPNEGLWKYNSTTGEMIFTPVIGFKGNPTPIQYTFTNTTTGLTSAPATIKVGYSGSPIASDDIKIVQNYFDPVIVTALTNDVLSNGTKPTATNVTVKLFNPETGLPAVGNTITIPGQGTWTYNPTTTEFTFIAESGHKANTTSLVYEIREIASGKTTKATINITVDAALPVTLASFASNTKEGYATLTWMTTSEINAAFFEIQKSSNAQDWNIIDQVKAIGREESKQTYEFTDPTRITKQTYYRLRMVDLDGTFQFSNILSINSNPILSINTTGHPQITVYPNPTSDFLFIKDVYTDQIAEINIVSGVGTVVYQSNTIPQHGINVNGLDQGIYVVKLKMVDGTINTNKIVIVR